MTASPPRYVGSLIILAITGAASAIIKDPLLERSLIVVAVVTAIVGFIDERYNIRPLLQFTAQVVIASILVFGGWVITHITNPFGPGLLDITALPSVGSIIPIALTIIWFVFFMNAINWFDGSDGLAAAVSAAAFMALALISILPATRDNTMLSLSLVSLVITAAFLVWNWQPARVYLGTSGSWFLGLWVGALAISSSGKIAATVIILALPILDVIAVSISRIRSGIPPWRGDTKRHIHHRLMAKGWQPARIASTLAGITLLLGVSTVALQAYVKPDAPSTCFNFTQAHITVEGMTFNAALARTPLQQQRGLGGCDRIKNNQAMYFPIRPAAIPSFWMRNMRFPIDIIWIRDGIVVGIEHSLAAPQSTSGPLNTYRPPSAVDAVLEVNAGLAKKYGIETGSSVVLVLTNTSQ